MVMHYNKEKCGQSSCYEAITLWECSFWVKLGCFLKGTSIGNPLFFCKKKIKKLSFSIIVSESQRNGQ